MQTTDSAPVSDESTAAHAISGRVMDSDGLGIGDVPVIAFATRLYGRGETTDRVGSTVRYRTLTDPVGFYSFRGLPDGDYVIRTKEHGPYGSARISVRAGVRYADLVLKKEKTFFVEGRVISTDGEPLEGVTVLPIVLGVPSVRTDDQGHYRLPVTAEPDLRSLTLRFQRPGFLETHVALTSADLSSAESEAAAAVMQPIEYWTAVSGRVTNAEGSALAGRTIELRPLAKQRLYSVTTDAEGRFLFPAVEAPLAYRLHVTGAPDHKDHRQQIRITGDEADFDIVVEPFEFGEVTGRLVNLEGVPIPDFNLVLRNTDSAMPNAQLSSDADGNFNVPAAPAGELVLASQSMPSILVRGLHLDPGDELHVPLVLDWGRHEIRGLVVDRHGNPVPASRILLKWSHRADGISSMATRRTAADAQGSFLFSQLGPGPHSLLVDAPGHPPIAFDHDASRQGYDVTVRLN